MTEPMSDEALAEVRDAVAHDEDKYPEDWECGPMQASALLAEVDRLRAVLARVTDDSMVDRLDPIIDHVTCNGGEFGEEGTALVLAEIRAAAEGRDPNPLPTCDGFRCRCERIAGHGGLCEVDGKVVKQPWQ